MRYTEWVYIYEQADWPHFRWSATRLEGLLGQVRYRQGMLLGRILGLGFPLQAEAALESLSQEVLKTNEIEGLLLDPGLVHSSLARRLGMDVGGLPTSDRVVEGMVEMLLDATGNCRVPLTPSRLWSWQAALFPTGRSGIRPIRVGAWRDDRTGPMEVVSGPLGQQTVHFRAPAADRIDQEIGRFLHWFESDQGQDGVMKAAVAHLWFITLHPFEDGNGRVARAIADMALARAENSPQRFYSMSSQICAERKSYYRILEWAQKGEMDVSDWLEWFLQCLGRAIEGSEARLSGVVRRAHFWDSVAAMALNDRQRRMLSRLLDDFEGKLTSSKWAKMAKCSQDTAQRDIQDLVSRGVLRKSPAGGRSTSYSLIGPS